ncbi:MAG: hypothetical protein ACREUW_00975 [Burkholderiales bacterium]
MMKRDWKFGIGDWRTRAAASATGLIHALAVFTLCCAPAAAADTAAAKPQSVTLLQQWNGRVPAPPDSAPAVITDRGTLEQLWRAWQIKAPLPDIDFSRELVLTHVARSSLTRFMGFTLDDKGDLNPQIVATPDIPGFSSYAICVIKRAGIKSVRGQSLK